MVLLTLALAAMVLMLFVRGISEDFTVAIVFGILSITSVTILILLFRKISASVTT
jgi:preprotein translocase subunit SecF